MPSALGLGRTQINEATDVLFLAIVRAENSWWCCPGAGTKMASTIAERIRCRISEQITSSRQVTISGGIAWFVQGENMAETIKRADESLYAAKDQGRNRILTADQENIGRQEPSACPTEAE